MSTTTTGLAPWAPPVAFFYVCQCCLTHGDLPLAVGAVVCKTCGGQCSCPGCVAEAHDA